MKPLGKVKRYIQNWEAQGYPEGIPDIVPRELMKENLAPSWEAIAIALLRNDMHLTSLGFSAPKSKWYSAIKRVEIEEREKAKIDDSAA